MTSAFLESRSTLDMPGFQSLKCSVNYASLGCNKNGQQGNASPDRPRPKPCGNGTTPQQAAEASPKSEFLESQLNTKDAEPVFSALISYFQGPIDSQLNKWQLKCGGQNSNQLVCEMTSYEGILQEISTMWTSSQFALQTKCLIQFPA
eukprot:Gregarina_sp_Poly_1__4591@NODE_245_length_10761_cov_123_252572_g215_i0_p4_GENE_NODE_245_length_10761_cov_123_252572_g215_i0NODE_245_length_10761_cov_123_252572_g215_i0_p4_ORF_typecomplete_len148_score14_22_NODE_245_length_10761_cov_123_252572_g215_i01023910682